MPSSTWHPPVSAKRLSGLPPNTPDKVWCGSGLGAGLAEYYAAKPSAVFRYGSVLWGHLAFSYFGCGWRDDV